MADASIIDIGGVQWNVKDKEARNEIANLKLECKEKANKSEIPTTVEQLTDSSSYAKKTDIPDVSGLEQNIADLNSNFTNEKKFIPANAYVNGVLSDALLIDLYNYKGENNKPRLVIDSQTIINMPQDCAWGVREVFVVGYNYENRESFLTVKITGCDKDGMPAIWLNIYNKKDWYGWVKK